MENAVLTAQIQGMSLEQESDIVPDHALFSWMEDEEMVFANDTSTAETPRVKSDYNTRSKRRFTGEAVVSLSDNPQCKDVSDQIPGGPTESLSPQRRKEIIITKAKEQKSPSSSPLNVVEQLKKSPANMSLWDILAIPEQKTILQKALQQQMDPTLTEPLASTEAVYQMPPTKVVANKAMESHAEGGGRPKPQPFFLTLIIGEKLLHNAMIDSGASTTVMPKLIAEALGLSYEPMKKGVMQLDGNKVDTVGVIKALPLTLFACPSITVPQDTVIIDVPPMFGLCLSREFTSKVGGYLSLDWSHLILRTKHGAKMKIESEALHSEHVANEALINFEAAHTSITKQDMYNVELLEEEKVNGDRSDSEDALLSEHINNDPFGNYHATGLGTYVIYDEDQVLPKVVKEPDDDQASELWTLYFDGARSKVGAGAGICLISPQNEKLLRAFRFQFACSNNEAEYEGLVQGLSLAERMGIKQLIMFGDFELIVNQVWGISVVKNV